MASDILKLDPREEHFRDPRPPSAAEIISAASAGPTRRTQSRVRFSTCTAPPFRRRCRSRIVSMAFHGATR